MEWFISQEEGHSGSVCAFVLGGGGGVTNETMFSQQNGRERMNWTCIGL